MLLVCSIVLTLFAPWQQSISGSGNVIAYAPGERQQSVEAPIKGRIVNWGADIYENAQVSKGQLIAEIQDLDAGLSGRLDGQREAGASQVEAVRQQLAASRRNLEAIESVVETFDSQLVSYRDVREQTIAVADAFIESAKQKVTAEQQALQEQHAALSQVQADYERQKKLFDESIASQLKFQESERKFRETTAKVAKAEAYVAAAKSDLTARERDRLVKIQKSQIDIDYARAMIRKAQGDVSKAEGEVAKSESELQKARKDLIESEVKVERQRSQSVVAPFDGIIVQITPNQGGRLVKEGDPLCVIVPDTKDRAVQIWLQGNDAPLVEPGRHVRLQFEGWPAVQFTGWPSVAVGTFGGTVISVDATDDGRGRFRTLIRPDKDTNKWPSGRFLRQGVRANGWVLLNRVPLWFEVWRKINAFPPVVSMDTDSADGKSGKSKK